MKLRHPWAIKLAAWIGAWIIRGWVGSLRFRYYCFVPNIDPRRGELTDRYIYAFWHENMLLPAYHYGRPDILVLISQHADGQLIANICRHLGFGLVRGSTTRGGVEALRYMLRAGGDVHLAITPDGPRGPRRIVQPGVVYLAARTGLPIVPVGIGHDRPWRIKSWDRFAVPRPWSQARCVLGEPMAIPAEVDRDRLEYHRVQVERALLQATEIAERWAATGSLPPAVYPGSAAA